MVAPIAAYLLFFNFGLFYSPPNPRPSASVRPAVSTSLNTKKERSEEMATIKI